MTNQEYNDIIECIKFGCPAKAISLIKSLNDMINDAIDKQVNQTNITEGDEK